jgi:predicted phage terminase large subunit-like protein
VWFLSLWNQKKVILASYAAEFAAEWGRKVRDEIDAHGHMLRVQLRSDSSAVNRWDLVTGGGMRTAGVDGGITGKGADLLIIDDPVKNDVEASSEVYRQRAWRFWTSTAHSRMEPGGSIVVVMTRWHEDDLVGRILAQRHEEDLFPWTVINFPAIAEGDDVLGRKEGDALWPARYGAEHLRAIERTAGPYDWAALYQQRPAPLEGGWFSVTQLRKGVVDDVPAEARANAIRYWDRAATRKKTAARTAGVLAGFHEGILYVLDVALCQEEPKEVEDLMKVTATDDGREVEIYIEQEPGSSGKTVFDHFAREVLPRFSVRTDRPTGDKATRAKPLSAKVAAGNVRLLKGRWNRDFIEELGLYPNGRFKDQVDATAGALDKLTADAEAEIF